MVEWLQGRFTFSPSAQSMELGCVVLASITVPRRVKKIKLSPDHKSV